MHTTQRRLEECRSCESTNLIDILLLGNFYLSDFTSDDTLPESYPLDIILCNDCFLLQLRYTTPQSLLYTENYGYKSGINKTMNKELKEIAQKVLILFKEKKGKLLAVDIGANDGTLVKNYPGNVTKVAIEPIKKLAKEAKEHADIVVNDFFNYKSYKKALGDKKADIITAISCFYDMEEPNEFVKDITKILNENGVFVIQQNYLKSMLQLNAFDNIVHEHLEYYSLLSLNNLLKRHNLEVFKVEETPINGGSFRTYIAFKGKRKIEKSVYQLLDEEKNQELHTKKPYKAFAKRVKDNKKKLKEFIKSETKKGKKIYLYGASTRGNTLIQYFELNNKLILAAVERNPEKWGKKIASVSIPIISEEQARKEKPDYMVVLPWFFKEEFLAREKRYLQNGGHFIFPLPDFEIV
ncbi:MAG TPA: class I SAM-dependent methyltransferase [Candidatus Saccharimonadales bacterium]|nr:class I SAM-dependent methyltransferase [Candidatus Saccharimonadales bacterium]